MRQVEKQVIGAFLNGEKKSVTNTMTDGHSLWLFGHKIARRVPSKRLTRYDMGFNGKEADTIEVNFCGYATPTTQSRLNSLCELIGIKRPFTIKKGVVSLIGSVGTNGKPTKTAYKDNEWIRIRC